MKTNTDLNTLTGLSCSKIEDFPGSYSNILLGSARYFLVSTFLSGGPHSFLPQWNTHISMNYKIFRSSADQTALMYCWRFIQFVIVRPIISASVIQLLHVRQVLLSIAVSGPQLEEGWHRWRWRYRWRWWVPEAAVVWVALGERPVGVCPGCRVWHSGAGQAVVICFTKVRDISN